MRHRPSLLVLALGARLVTGCATLPEPPPPVPPPPPPMASVAAPVAEEAVDPVSLLNEGAWTARDPASDFYLRYRFRDGRYSTAGHPTWTESGRMEVVERDGRRLVVRFVDRIYDGHEDEPLELELVLDEEGASFVMGGRRFIHEPTVHVAAQTDEGDEGEPVTAEPAP